MNDLFGQGPAERIAELERKNKRQEERLRQAYAALKGLRPALEAVYLAMNEVGQSEHDIGKMLDEPEYRGKKAQEASRDK